MEAAQELQGKRPSTRLGQEDVTRDIEVLANYARVASERRGLTVGELIEDLSDRLLAIGGFHHATPRAESDALCPAKPFLDTLIAPFAASGHRIHVACDPDLELPASELGPIGMIVSEATSNALKHAFPDNRDGDVWIRLAAEDGRIAVTIRDNGKGMPDLDGGRLRGRGLIDSLARQLGGWARLGSAPFGGALVTVVYKRP